MKRKIKVLIVEDSVIISNDLNCALLQQNYDIAGFFSKGEEAFDKIDDLQPDVILMDISLAGEWDGIETTRRIKEKFQVPVIYITGNTDDIVFKKATITGNYGFIDKPLNFNQIFISIESAIHKFKQEMVIKEHEQWLNLTLNAISDGVIAIDMNWNIKFINFEALWLLGKETKEVIGKPFDIIMSDIINKSKIKDILKVLKEKKYDFSGMYIYTFYNKNSDVNLTVECTYALMKNKMNDIQGVVCSLKNITIQKMRDEELAKLSNIVEIMDETVIITDTGGLIEYVNPAFETVTGWKKHGIIGKKSSIIKSDTHSKKLYNNLWQTILSGSKWSGHLVNLKKDKTHYHCNLTIIPVKDNLNEIIRFVGVGKDITAEVHSQIQLVNMHRMSALATLSGAVAHEINQPLSGIRVYTQILVEEAQEKQETLEKDVIELGKKIDDQVTRINGIINHLKTFAKDDNTIRKAKILISDLIKDTLDLVGTQLKSKGIRINVSIPDELYLISDKIKLEQVIINILTNAKNAFDNVSKTDKTIYVEAYKDHAKKIIVIKISDNGPGISEGLIDKLYEPFVSGKSTEGVAGLGLGLAICKDIMKQLNGKIKLEKTDETGTTFLLEISDAN